MQKDKSETMKDQSNGDEVNSVDPLHIHVPGTNWQILGELRLQGDSSPDGTIKAWLRDVLSDLGLPDDFVSRLLASIEKATVCVLSSDHKQGEYVNIVVLASAGQASRGHTWGFFRVERASTDSQIENAKGHFVEFYLYLDKKAGEWTQTAS